MNEPNDNLLDDYLRGNSPVSQRYRELESADVPPHLDAAVLAQARAAVDQSSARKAHLSRWGAPLAIAASAVFAIAVVLEIGVQEEVRMPASVAYQKSESDVATETPAALADVTTASESPRQAQTVQGIDVEEQRAAAQASREARERSVEASSERQARAAAPAAPPSAVQRAVAPRPETVTVTGSSIRGTPEDAALPVEVFTQNELAQLGQPPPMQIDEPSIAGLEEDEAVSTGSFAKAAEPMPRTESRRAAPARASASAPAQGPRLEPQPWLERIRELRRDGKILEADEQWREFVASYPDYEVEKNDLARPPSR